MNESHCWQEQKVNNTYSKKKEGNEKKKIWKKPTQQRTLIFQIGKILIPTPEGRYQQNPRFGKKKKKMKRKEKKEEKKWVLVSYSSLVF